MGHGWGHHGERQHICLHIVGEPTWQTWKSARSWATMLTWPGIHIKADFALLEKNVDLCHTLEPVDWHEMECSYWKQSKEPDGWYFNLLKKTAMDEFQSQWEQWVPPWRYWQCLEGIASMIYQFAAVSLSYTHCPWTPRRSIQTLAGISWHTRLQGPGHWMQLALPMEAQLLANRAVSLGEFSPWLIRLVTHHIPMGGEIQGCPHTDHGVDIEHHRMDQIVRVDTQLDVNQQPDCLSVSSDGSPDSVERLMMELMYKRPPQIAWFCHGAHYPSSRRSNQIIDTMVIIQVGQD